MTNLSISISQLWDRLAHESIINRIHIAFRLISFPFKELLPIIPSKGVLVDIGCGFGILSYLLAYSRKDKILAFDPAKNKIAVAQRLLAEFKHVVIYPAQSKLPVFKPHPEVITLLDVLYLLPTLEKKALLINLFTQLKPGGKLLVAIVPKERTFRYLAAWLQEAIMVRVLGGTFSRKQQINFETTSWMKGTLTKIGFKKIYLHCLPTPWPFFHHHLLFVAQKPKNN